MEWLERLGGRTAVMGIVNVTPDSFSDGGRHDSPGAAAAHAKQLVADGADLLDVGGESTRPGAEDVPVDEELNRTIPVVEAISSLGVPISIDTRKAAVAEAALDAGASIVNDVSAGTFDLDLLPLVAERGCELVLMHMRGTPRTMDAQADYDDVVEDVKRELIERLAAAQAAGVSRDRVLVDPGLGFAKTAEHSLELVARIQELCDLGPPILVGPSRKRFVGHVTGDPVEARVQGTAAVCAWCAGRGVDVVRVHDVAEVRTTVDTIHAIREAAR